MSTSDAVDMAQTHYRVLGLDENATIVRRQIEESYEKRATQVLQRLEKIDTDSDEAAEQRARLAQLNAARGVLVPRKAREAYKGQLGKLREAERALKTEEGKAGGKGFRKGD